MSNFVAGHWRGSSCSWRAPGAKSSRPLVKELQAAAVKSATLIIEAAGFTPPPERMDELSRLLNGFVFSNLTVAPEPGAQDAAGLVDRLLSAFLD